jgi:hypothetical protein
MSDLKLPARADIASEHWGGSNAHDFVQDWFYSGASLTRLTPKAGVEKGPTIRAIGKLLESFHFEHNHKIAGCAQLIADHFEVADAG